MGTGEGDGQLEEDVISLLYSGYFDGIWAVHGDKRYELRRCFKFSLCRRLIDMFSLSIPR